MATTKKTTTKAAAPEVEHDHSETQPAFGPDIPTATVTKFFRAGPAGAYDARQFEGKYAEEEAKAFVDANADPTWYWTTTLGSRAYVPKVDIKTAEG